MQSLRITMTLQSPRIYVYKITFEEVPYYYYGVKKEKYFNQEYWGSPKTNKWCWELYTPKKQILELFDYTDEGWLEALEVEKRLIRSVFNKDKWCLNETCGGKFSHKVLSINGKKSYELGVGIHGRTPEQMSEDGKKGGQSCYEKKLGVHGRTPEQMSEDGKKSGKKAQELGVGIHGLTKEERVKNCKLGGHKSYELSAGIHGLTEEERVKNCKLGGQKAYELKVGIHGRTPEQMSEDGKKSGKISGQKSYKLKLGFHARTREQRVEHSKKVVKITNSQRWMCTITGHISNPGGLSRYQKARNIDTSNRIKITSK